MANEPPGRLAGKVCVVTGTGGSMGRAAALTFAREGASVVGCDVAVEPAEETVKMVHAAGGEMVSLQPQLKASRGVVVNMASLNGSLSFKNLPAIAHMTNKSAITGMTRQLAMEGSAHGIRVNSVSPGFIETNATRGELENETGIDLVVDGGMKVW
jgi:NAD(P)-dependent dehydrogenase (short-subunit alcohol dehydrogenase family)